MINARIKENICWKEILHTVCILVVFILCVRFLKFDFLYNISGVKEIYARLSQICAIIVMLVFIFSFKKVPKVLYISLCAVYGITFITTFINTGNFRVLIGSAYPVLALNAFVLLECTSVDRAKKFVKTLANFFVVITTINIFLMIVAPNLFNSDDIYAANYYFLGAENHMGYSCVAGLLIVLLNDVLNKEKWKVQWYAIVFGMTTLLNFSVGSLMGAVVLFLYCVVPYVKEGFNKRHLFFFVLIICLIMVILVFFNESVLGFAPIRFVIENILGKEITLSNRTIIWNVATEKILQRPIWGYGVGDTGNVFTITSIDGIVLTLSAHNQFLQMWYESGCITVIAVMFYLAIGGTLLKRCFDGRVGKYTKLVSTTLLVMYLTEAPNFGCLYFVLNLGVSIGLCLEKDQKNKKFVIEKLKNVSCDKITVVVPVYNVKNYLNDCLDSVINQTYKNLEIIVVNDGSTDESLSICKMYAEKDSRVILIDQKNQGLSSARNAGIGIATGKYITFVDSDDVICPDMIEYLYCLMILNNADMSVCQCQKVDEEGKPIEDCEIYQNVILQGQARCMKALFQDSELNVMACAKLYKTSAFETVKYVVGKYHEDVYATYQLIAQCNCIAAGADRKYLYRQRGGSIVHSVFSLKHLDAVEGSILQAQFVEKCCPEIKREAQGQIIWACNSCTLRMKNCEQLDEKAVSYLQRNYRKYESAFLLGNYRMIAKLFSIVAFINLSLTLRILKMIFKLRR